MIWKIILTIQAKTMLEDIQDRRVQEKIRDRINGLVDEPEKQGKLLTGELTGYRSLRAVGQRYRIIYRVEEDRVLVLVVAIGIRKEGNQKDIYSLARKILRLRLLEPPQE
ncbi:plasmid stabilization protein [Peptococcaceae bacterium SCADC1_2_3]|nr:plasmid stabilization protein [Peptococcaceae bacterium SCADC1_2_3]KFI35678.1 plasmid stabilization protein [Peptococcaceae bacterium SCADC1_2_3]